MACSCTDEKYTCGETASAATGSNSHATLTHSRNRKTSFMLGVTEVIVNKANRNFSISHTGGWSFNPSFFLSDEGATVTCGGAFTSTKTHAVSESYEVVNTALYFLDMRYNNAIGRETTETVTFSEASNAVATFQGTWGQMMFPKAVIINHRCVTKVDYFIVLAGVKTILKTTTSDVLVNGPTNPLILVWPNPPSLATPWLGNGDTLDILQYGFYDYHAVGDEEGQVKIRRDGGDDFYFTDWMRNVGAPSLIQDQADAEARYFDFYLGDGISGTSEYSNPGILIDSTPIGSIAQDKDGNIFYSLELDGEIFNSLSEPGAEETDPRIEADLASLFPDLGPNQKFFPVGLV